MLVNAYDDMMHDKNESAEEVEKYLVPSWNQTFISLIMVNSIIRLLSSKYKISFSLNLK